jgi:hypothetical protein
MADPVLCVDYTIPGGLDWAERGLAPPLSIKHGDCVCVIERADPTCLILAKGYISENTGRYIKNDDHIHLPFTGRFCRFMELGDTLCVFVMADDMQTCAIFDWNTHQTYAHSQIPIPLPANARLDRVAIDDENTMQLTYTIDRVTSTIDIALSQV